MQPPDCLPRRRLLIDPQACEVRDHQCENQERDEARFRRDFAEPFWPHDKAADEQTGDRYGDRHGPYGHEAEIESAETRVLCEESSTERGRKMIDGNQSEC